MATITLEEFNDKYCKSCGSQLCHNVYDVDLRNGCAHYQKEILHQPTLQDLLNEINSLNSEEQSNKESESLESKILNLPFWLDGTVLVVSRDAVLDIIKGYTK